MDRILHLPFVHTCRLRAATGTVTREVKVRDAVPVAIPHIDADAAPVALTLVHGETPAGRRETPLRFHGGRLFRPLAGPDAEPVPLEDFQADLSRPSSVWREKNLLRRIAQDFIVTWRADTFPAPGGERLSEASLPMAFPSLEEAVRESGRRGRLQVVGDDREGRAAQWAGAYAQGLLVVDGRVWTSHLQGEPCWALVLNPKRRQVQVQVRASATLMPGAHPYRADKLEEAVRAARTWADRIGHELVMDPHERIIVQRADLLGLEDFDLAVRAGAALLKGIREAGGPAVLAGHPSVEGRLDAALLRAEAGPLGDEDAACVLVGACAVLAEPGAAGEDPGRTRLGLLAQRWAQGEREGRPGIARAFAALGGDEAEIADGLALGGLRP